MTGYPCWSSQLASVRIERRAIEAREDDLFDGTGLLELSPHRCGGNSRCLVEGITVDAGTDGGKGDALQPFAFRQHDRRAIGRGEELRFVRIAALPDRAHRMNHKTSRQREPRSDPRLACRTRSRLRASRLELSAC